MPDVHDEVIELSESLTIDWVHAFLEEMNKIENFFVKKQDELINEFIGLQDKFRIKTDVHEQEKQKERDKKEKKDKKKKKDKDKGKKDKQIDEIIEETGEEEELEVQA